VPPRTNEALRELLAPVIEQVGYELDGLSVTPAGRRRLVRVTVDGDTPVDLDTVADISRAISDALDAADVFGPAPYVLEVGSPGVERPLTEPRHWRRAVGRLVEVTPVPGSGGPVTGRLLEVTDGGVVLDIDGSARELAWAGVDRARVQVEFRRPDDPDDDSGDGDDPGDDEAPDDGDDEAPDDDEPPNRAADHDPARTDTGNEGGGTTWIST
jgi:ribosome maturation factor RimP